ncbi:PAS domain-containing protein [Thermodesulfobacteriota bacterium]
MKDEDKTKEPLVEELKSLRMQSRELEDENFRRETAEQTPAEALDRQRAIPASIPDMAWLKDSNGRFLAANEAFLTACGINLDDLLGITDSDYWPDGLSRKYQYDDVEVMRSGKHKRIEETLVHSKDEPIWIEIIKSPSYNDQGMVIGTTGIARDITARKQAQNEREQLVTELQRALAHVRQLSGLLPICASCKNTRDDRGYWQQIEEYIRDHSEADFSHGICPECARKLYPEFYHED